MPPSRESVAEMSAVLVRVSGNVARASRARTGAARLAILRAVAEGSEPRPSDLATHLALSRASVTKQLQELSADGLVELTVDENDRRSFFVSLTEAGRAQYDALTERGLQRFALFTAEWDDDDVRELARLLTKLESSIAHAVRNDTPIAGRPWQRRD
ncbi:MarR family winged helix-turn-helix transcriptional regulator [Cryptosporangium phraense]|uniref:Winged helix-turn-helix transcriptional regulator n=1 Tax=Cryptosporangium phraense TaxID=2593070 RepID=A0A545AXQ8_9ACTN|nr:MarR family winged helix-turn-helix transcriptional regulator [Cryptosporangium phraense]TQS46119.1 winged helix-turn-helix transcriptional regulator [Cryptosporangium phraense]